VFCNGVFPPYPIRERATLRGFTRRCGLRGSHSGNNPGIPGTRYDEPWSRPRRDRDPPWQAAILRQAGFKVYTDSFFFRQSSAGSAAWRALVSCRWAASTRSLPQGNSRTAAAERQGGWSTGTRSATRASIMGLWPPADHSHPELHKYSSAKPMAGSPD
jgi:hypothetical protein